MLSCPQANIGKPWKEYPLDNWQTGVIRTVNTIAESCHTDSKESYVGHNSRSRRYVQCSRFSSYRTIFLFGNPVFACLFRFVFNWFLFFFIQIWYHSKEVNQIASSMLCCSLLDLSLICLCWSVWDLNHWKFLLCKCFFLSELSAFTLEYEMWCSCVF